MRFLLLGLILISQLAIAQSLSDESPPVRIGPGVAPPKLIHKVEPEYSAGARAAGIQGTVVFELVVNEQGKPVDITVTSPLGYGLDEKAQAAIEKWGFKPGIKDGKPVKVLAQIEMNFRLLGRDYDEKNERRRTTFNLTQQTLSNPNSAPPAIDRAVTTMIDLSKQKFPPAMSLVGGWLCSGEHLPKNCAEGLEFFKNAATKYYGPAIYEIGIRRIEGRDLPQDIEKGLQDLREAATLGSRQAQFYLGVRYENGDGVPREPDRARRYYRLCAVDGVAICQFRLGRLLYNQPDRRERDLMQAVALFQLAADHGYAEAGQMVARENPKLTAEQVAWVASLKRHMARK